MEVEVRIVGGEVLGKADSEEYSLQWDYDEWIVGVAHK